MTVEKTQKNESQTHFVIRPKLCNLFELSKWVKNVTQPKANLISPVSVSLFEQRINNFIAFTMLSNNNNDENNSD